MAIIYGTTEEGLTVPVQANAAGQLVAMGLEGAQGPPGDKGDTGDEGPQGPPGDIYAQLPPDPWDGASLGWENGALAWLGTPPPPYGPNTIGPLVSVDLAQLTLTSESSTHFENFVAGNDVVMTDVDGNVSTFIASTEPVTDVEVLNGEWTAETAAASVAYKSVVYGNGMYVAVAYGETDAVMYSSDGISWTAVNGASSSNWRSVAFGDGRFVAIANSGANRVMYSDDAINWFTANPSATNSWYDVCYGDGKFVAVSTNGSQRVMYSTNGVNWYGRNASASAVWVSVTYGGGKFVAVSQSAGNVVMYSSNATTWSNGSSSASGTWEQITWGNDRFVAVAPSGTNRVMWSSNGINFSAATAPDQDWLSVAYGADKFVAVSDDGTERAMYSADGETWTLSPGSTTDSEWHGICFGDEGFVAVADTGNDRVMWSATGDGINEVNLTVDTINDGNVPWLLRVGDAITQSGTDASGEIKLKESDKIVVENPGGTWTTGVSVSSTPKSGTGRIVGTPSSTAPTLELDESNGDWYAGDVYVTQQV